MARILTSPWAIACTGLGALALAMGIGRFAYTPLLPMMQSDQGMSLQTGSWIALANMLGYLVGGLTGKYLAHAPVRHLRLASTVLILTLVAMVLTTNPVLWGLWRLIAGVASAWMMILVSIITLPRLAGSPRLPGVVYAGVGSGIFFAGLLCALFVARDWSSRSAWLTLGSASVLIAWPLWRVFDRSWDADSRRIPGTSVSRPARTASRSGDSRLWLLVVCYGLYGFGYILPATYLPAQARLVLGDTWTYSLAWPVLGFAAATSTFVVGLVAARLGLLRSWLVAQGVLAVGVVIPLVWPTMTGILAASLCVGLTFVVITLVAMQEAQRCGAERSGLWMARLTAAFGLGQILGPGVVVVLEGQVQVGLALAAGVLLVSLVALGLQLIRDSRQA